MHKTKTSLQLLYILRVSLFALLTFIGLTQLVSLFYIQPSMGQHKSNIQSRHISEDESNQLTASLSESDIARIASEVIRGENRSDRLVIFEKKERVIKSTDRHSSLSSIKYQNTKKRRGKHNASSVKKINKGKFLYLTIQTGSYKTKSEAIKSIKTLATKGIKAFSSTVMIKNQTWHRVQIGKFKKRPEANLKLLKLKTQIPISSFIRTLVLN